MSAFSEMPASPKPSEEVAIHWSRKLRGHGIKIGKFKNGKFGIYNIGPIEGIPTAFMFDTADTEEEARKIANQEWVWQDL